MIFCEFTQSFYFLHTCFRPFNLIFFFVGIYKNLENFIFCKKKLNYLCDEVSKIETEFNEKQPTD